ncbi:hypothetical protein [Zhengella mangrovi]|nr:hypothetical protein [Zhengella mangrovi]
MRRWITASIILAMTTGALADTAPSICRLQPDGMPESWRPSEAMTRTLDASPWTDAENVTLRAAVSAGLDGLIALFANNPDAVMVLWDDSIEMLLQVTYSADADPDLSGKARAAAGANLSTLIGSYDGLDPAWAACKEYDALLPLAVFAHRLYEPGDSRTAMITARTNASAQDCGSLDDAITIDYRDLMAEKGVLPGEIEDLFDLALWSIWLTEAAVYPDIRLPAGADRFAPEAMDYLRSLTLGLASNFSEGADGREFELRAQLARQIAYIPSDNQRFPLYVADMPELHRFIRENFYPALQAGSYEIISSFVDTLRQYGCTPANDRQVRDGTRFLLKEFATIRQSWTADGGMGDGDPGTGAFSAWAAIRGLRERIPLTPQDGNYGAIIRSWLPAPASP